MLVRLPTSALASTGAHCFSFLGFSLSESFARSMTCHATLISSTVSISWLATCVHFFFVYLRSFYFLWVIAFLEPFLVFLPISPLIDISTLVSLHVELVGCVLSNACYRFSWYEVLRGVAISIPASPCRSHNYKTCFSCFLSFFSVNVYVIMNNVIGRTTEFHTVHTQHYAFVYSLHM